MKNLNSIPLLDNNPIFEFGFTESVINNNKRNLPYEFYQTLINEYYAEKKRKNKLEQENKLISKHFY